MMPMPISCPRIRESMISISAALNCDCNFQRMPGDYPSPVLYTKGPWSKQKKHTPLPSAPSEEHHGSAPPDSDQIKDMRSAFMPEIEQLMDRIAKLRQQQQGVESSILRCGQRLSQIFDQIGADQVITKVGKLTREKNNDEISWSIKL